MNIAYDPYCSFKATGGSGVLIVDPSEGFDFGKDFNRRTIVLNTTEVRNKPHTAGQVEYIQEPGEYGIGEVDIRALGIASAPNSEEQEQGVDILYGVEMDRCSVLVIGAMYSLPSEQLLSSIGDIAVVLVDVDKSELEEGQLSRLLRSVEPRVVVARGRQGAQLAKEMAVKEPQSVQKVTLNTKSLNREGNIEYYLLQEQR